MYVASCDRINYLFLCGSFEVVLIVLAVSFDLCICFNAQVEFVAFAHKLK